MSIIDDTNFYYITVATKPHPILDILIKTVESKNESLEILGLENNCYIGQDLPNGSRRFGIKLLEVYNFLKRDNLKDNDIILFSDAYDVYYSGNKSTIIERFNKMNKPIVFGGEQCCYPDASKSSLYPTTNSPFRYLNSGLFIGRVYALRESMKDYVYLDDTDDQLWWTNKFLERQDLIELDYNNLLFLNCVWLNKEDLIIYEDKVTFRNGNTPQLTHGNGPSKELIEPLLKYAKSKFNL